ncbi:MAG: glycerate kinase [Opitutales bacterium]
MKRILVAFDKFKDSIAARPACDLAQEVIRQSRPDVQVEKAPLTDGGEGFAEILTREAGGELRTAQVCGPRLQPVLASYGIVSADRVPEGVLRRFSIPDSGTIAIVEMAQAAGLELLEDRDRDPFLTTTRGVGEVLGIAASQQVDAILMGVGGSATHDLGIGALTALGLEIRTRDEPEFDRGPRIPPHGALPGEWPDVRSLACDKVANLPRLFIACDVDNPLLGRRGAAAVFARQKGMAEADFPSLEKETQRMAQKLCRCFRQDVSLMDEPGSGAAGGIAFGFRAAFGADRVAGFPLVADWLKLDAKIEAADLVVTGEGCFDESSLSGKGAGSLLRKAVERKKPVLLLAGRHSLDTEKLKELEEQGVTVVAVSPPDLELSKALKQAPERLRAALRHSLEGM